MLAFVHVHVTSTSRGLHSSWTEASRGDRTSPKHVIIHRSDKCNNNFLSPVHFGVRPFAWVWHEAADPGFLLSDHRRCPQFARCKPDIVRAAHLGRE